MIRKQDINRTLSYRDYVEFGNKNFSIRYNELKGDKSLSAQKRIGRYSGEYDSEHAIISYFKDRSTKFIIPKSDIYPLITGSKINFLERIRPVLNLKIKFTAQQKIRFRDNFGFIQNGHFERAVDENTSQVHFAGKKLLISNGRLFDGATGIAATLTYQSEYYAPSIEKINNELEQFLNGAAKISSLPEYKNLTEIEQINLLYRYLSLFTQWTQGALENKYLSTLIDYNRIIRSGAACCYHLSPLALTLLSENGFSTTIVTHEMKLKDRTVFHMWVEGELSNNNERIIIDPTYKSIKVSHFQDVLEKAINDPHDREATRCTQPDRVLHNDKIINLSENPLFFKK